MVFIQSSPVLEPIYSTVGYVWFFFKKIELFFPTYISFPSRIFATQLLKSIKLLLVGAFSYLNMPGYCSICFFFNDEKIGYVAYVSIRGAPDRKISVRPDNRTGLIEGGYRPDRTLYSTYALTNCFKNWAMNMTKSKVDVCSIIEKNSIFSSKSNFAGNF